MNSEVDVLLLAVKEAGAAIANLQKTGFSIARKANNDLLTQADLLANDILKSALMTNFPHYGWLSEESVDDPRRLLCDRVWIVDPIDGTQEYTQGISEYAVSAALIEKGDPILACVFNPITNEFFYACRGKGAWLNDKQIHSKTLSEKKYLLLASRSEYQRGEWQRFEQEHSVKVIGSIAYKLALIAAGKGDATFSLGYKNEWDIAAGVLLVTEAGGLVTDKFGNRFVFNQANVLVNGIIATTMEVNSTIFEMLGVS